MKFHILARRSFLLLVVFLMPLAAHAQAAEFLLLRIKFWVNAAVPIFAGLALLIFFWGLIKFIYYAGDEEKRKQGKLAMGWGIVALFVVASVWGIIFFISLSLGTQTGGSLPTPCTEGLPGCTRFFGRL